MGRYLLIIPAVLAVLGGTLFFVGALTEGLLERCPSEALIPGFDSTPPECKDIRYEVTNYLGVFASLMLAVDVMIRLVVFLAPTRKFQAAFYTALLSTWLVLLIPVLISDFDGFEYPDRVMLVQQLVIVLWAGIRVYLVKKRFGTEGFPSELEGVVLGLVAAALFVAYLSVVGIYF